MAFDEALAARARAALTGRIAFEEKEMFGGLASMVAGNMARGVAGRDLTVRVGPGRYEEALARPQVRPTDFTGRPLPGLVYVPPAGLDDAALAEWLDAAVAFATSPDAAAEKKGRQGGQNPPVGT